MTAAGRRIGAGRHWPITIAGTLPAELSGDQSAWHDRIAHATWPIFARVIPPTHSRPHDPRFTGHENGASTAPEKRWAAHLKNMTFWGRSRLRGHYRHHVQRYRDGQRFVNMRQEGFGSRRVGRQDDLSSPAAASATFASATHSLCQKIFSKPATLRHHRHRQRPGGLTA
jgi:hypothetical protein